LENAYTAGALAGKDMVSVHIEWLADALDYLKGVDPPLHRPYLDDTSKTNIEMWFDKRVAALRKEGKWQDSDLTSS
jgi:hypothetical protein